MKNYIVTVIAAIGLIVLLGLGMESCVNWTSSSKWNDGICVECGTRYELRGASRGFKYYACPNCGAEVTRM